MAELCSGMAESGSPSRRGLRSLEKAVSQLLNRVAEEALALLEARGGRALARLLRLLLGRRLAAVTGRVVGLLEREREEYRRQLHRQRRLLDAVLCPVVRLGRTDAAAENHAEETAAVPRGTGAASSEAPLGDGQVSIYEEANRKQGRGGSGGPQRDGAARLNAASQPSSGAEDEDPVQGGTRPQVGRRGKRTRERPYGCGVCGKNFPRPGALSRHRKTHGARRACPVCARAFHDHRRLLQHLRSVHGRRGGDRDEEEAPGAAPGPAPPFCCRVCGDSFHSPGFLRRHAHSHRGAAHSTCGVCGRQLPSAEALLPHLRAHRDLGGTCGVCGGTFRNVETHMRRHTGVRPHRCAVCGKSFPRPGALRRHRKTHAGEPPWVGGSSLERRSHSRPGSGPAPEGPAPAGPAPAHRCKVCGEWFARRGSLRSHVRTHPSACGLCGEGLSPPAVLAQHLRLHAEAGTVCPVCGKAYRNVEAHMRRHTGVRPFSCPTCGKSYPRPGALRRHRRLHTGERPYVCEFCGKTFVDSGALAAHIRRHAGEGPARRVSCDTCGKSLASAQVLEVHRRIHTGERPFLCRLCGRAFRQAGGLRAHALTHTGERPFGCRLCGKSFGTKGYLETHLRFHRRERAFGCRLCGKAFVTKNDLKKHLLTHSGERPYGCAVCGKSYREKRSRDAHARAHQGPPAQL